MDPIDPEVRRLLREGSLPETSRLWLILSAIQETGCEEEDRTEPVFVPSGLFPSDNLFTIVGRIHEVGALLLKVDSVASTTLIVQVIDALRAADGRAVFEGHPGQSWEIVSLELSSPVSRSLISSGLDSSWTCMPGNGDDIADGRRLLGSDPLKLKVRPTIRVGLLDSGVDLQSLSKTSVHARLDCLQGPSTGTTPSCDGLKPNDTNEQSHGTKSASILSGSDFGPYDGVTDLPLVSFKIGERMHQDEAVQRAVDVAGAGNHEVDVVLAQVQSTGHSRGVVAKMADYAFDHGLVVVAPVGNTGLSKRLTSPGNAHKALGVGAYRLGAPDRLLGGFGPTRDGRTKPDLLGPTGSEARARGVGQCGFHPQTSGAAPYVAGGVALLKNLVATTFGPKEADDPGLIYPLALVAGQTPFDPCRSERLGAGALVLPSSGRLFFGEVEIAEGEHVWLPIPDVEDDSTVDAAIWWPESITQEHSDIDLRLRNGCFGPAGTEGRSYGSVFERVRALVQPGCAGKLWHLELSAYSVSDSCLKNEHLGRQRVYWAAYVGSKPESPFDP